MVYYDQDVELLKRIAITGGAPVTIGPVEVNVDGLSWESDGTILTGRPEGVLRVPATGGTPELIIPAEDNAEIHGPRLLPDGDSVLFSEATAGDWDTARIVVHSLSTGERTVLVHGGSDARYLPTGHLVYVLGDGLFAVAFDADSLAVSGGAVPLVQGVMRSSVDMGTANYSVSAGGTLAYVPGSEFIAQPRTLVWMDREGREEAIAVPPRTYASARLSPDDTRVALEIRDQENDIWIWDFDRETLQRLTFDAGMNRGPIWSPDGERVAFLPGTRRCGGDLLASGGWLRCS